VIYVRPLLRPIGIVQKKKGYLMRNGFVALIAAAGLGIGLAQSANAADLSTPYYKAPPFATFSWTGWYVGVNGGGGWGQTSHTATFTAPGFAPLSTGNFNTNGGIVGGTVGYNYQFGQWLVGGEADLDWSNIQGTFNSPALGGAASLSSQLNWLETTRARVGWIWNRAVFYGTAGAALGGVTTSASAAGAGAALTGSDTQTRFGWTAGAGIEYAFTNNISAKVEYLHVDLGTQTQITVDSVKFTTDLVRGGINLRF
jgi:outer membrane immunogenic protein